VSLDGPEQTHNRIRGNEQSFARAVRRSELLKRAGTPVLSVATTVTKNNIKEIEDLKQVLLQLGVPLWRFAALMPIGRAEGAEASLDGEELAWLLRYAKENRSKRMHIYLAENLTFLGEWERRIRGRPLICPIGFTACCIGVDGTCGAARSSRTQRRIAKARCWRRPSPRSGRRVSGATGSARS